MKIAFILNRFPKLSETFIIDQIVVLIKRGHKVDIYAATTPIRENKIHPDVEKYSLLDRTFYYGYPSNKFLGGLNAAKLFLLNFPKNPAVILSSWNSYKYDKHQLFSKLLLPHLAIPFLKGQEYDIINCHFGSNALKAVYLKKLGLLKGKIVTTFHGIDITNYIDSFGKDVYEQLFEVGDLFLPVSKLWQKRLIELGCNPEKIIVHHMGIDCQEFTFKPRQINTDSKINIVTVARLVEKKGIEYAIRAVAKLTNKYQNLQYTIVGDGDLKESLQKLSLELNIEGIVTFLGWKDRQEVIEILRDASIMLAPSVTSKNGDMEGIPVGLMEAMAMGLLVISTYHSGIPELITDGVSGFLVPERDVDTLAAKLNYSLEHPELWQKIGLVGRQQVEKSYNINQLSDRLEAIYESLLREKT